MKQLLAIPTLLLVIALHIPARSLGWGATGHQIIVNTALSLLRDSTRQRVMSVLNNYPVNCAATWMDSVRHHAPYTYMDNWHFLNMNPNQTYKQVKSDTDVVYNLTRVRRTFEQRLALPADSVFMNLKVLFHLMGDISQPLHVGYSRDAGGNFVKVTDSLDSYETNLHHVWDDDIIIAGNLNVDSITNFCRSRSAAQKQLILAGTPEVWMKEARIYLRNAYAFTPAANGPTALPMRYLDINVPIVREQLGRAAMRLADALEKSFGDRR